MPRWILTLLLISLSLSLRLTAQLTASAAISITAKLPGSITLSFQSTPVSVSSIKQTFEVPLTVEWNVDPRETAGFALEAYFQDGQAALADQSGEARISSDDIVARWGSTAFQSFHAGRMRLFYTTVSADSRRGKKSEVLELRVAEEAIPKLPEGRYEGVLLLEVRNY